MNYHAAGNVVYSFSDPTESYQFLTPQVAQTFAAILNRDSQRYYNYGTTIPFSFHPEYDISAGCSINANAWQTVFKSNNRELVVWNPNGAITKLDLPYIIWIWLKLSPVAKFLRTAWKGTRAE